MNHLEITVFEPCQARRGRREHRNKTRDPLQLRVARGNLVVLLSDADAAGRLRLRGARPARNGGAPPGTDRGAREGTPSHRFGAIGGDPECQIIGATVAEDVAFGPENLGLAPGEIQSRVRQALEAVALDQLRERPVHLLSAPQKLRLALAGALALEPDCLLLQHPTRGLDRVQRRESARLLRSLSRDRGIAVVLVSDNPEEAAEADRVVVLREGELVLDGRPDAVLPGLPGWFPVPAVPPEPAVEPRGRTGAGAAALLRELTTLPYLPGASLLHRADPRTKITLALVFTGALYTLHSLAVQLLLLALLLGLGAALGQRLSSSLRGMKPILWLAGVAALVHLVSGGGTPLMDQGPLRHLSREALTLAGAMVLRLLLIANAAALLTRTTTPFALADGLAWFLRPLGRIGLPVSDLPMLLLLALRFLPAIAGEAERLAARRAPAERLNRGGPLDRARGWLPLLTQLLGAVAAKGDAIASALEARGYRSGAGRSTVRPLAFSAADLALAALLVLVISAATGLDRA